MNSIYLFLGTIYLFMTLFLILYNVTHFRDIRTKKSRLTDTHEINKSPLSFI